MKSINIKFKFLFLFSIILFASSCKKDNISNEESISQVEQKNKPPLGFFIENRKVPGVLSDKSSINIRNFTTENSSSSSVDLDNGDIPVILGDQLVNPYSVANMQQAVNTLYGGIFPITATHLYVRFKPNSADQLVALDENPDLELQDYPMDYELIQDGDYYQDPTLGDEDFPWLYTVVPINFSYPSGIQYQVLQELYLPENNEILEDLAESMVAGAQYSSERLENRPIVRIDREDIQVESFNYSLEQCPCLVPDEPCPVWPNCGLGGNPPPPTPTLPSGIYVDEQTVCSSQPNSPLPLRQVNVVAKRWFKRWSGYTDDNGKFTVTKSFKNKVKLIVKTRNGNARVSKVRGIRVWNVLFPNRVRLGVIYGSELPKFRYVFTKPTDGSASNKDLANWACATTHNSIVEFKQYTAEFGLQQPPPNLKVIVTNWSFMANTAAAPMWNKCNASNMGSLIKLISNVAGTAYGVLNSFRNQMDIIIGYKSLDYNCKLTSSELRGTVYHEVAHAQHFIQAGCGFWSQYRNSISDELFSSGFSDSYGNGTATTAPIIGTGEMWGYFAEKWYSERHYGNGGSLSNLFFSRMQIDDYFNSATLGLNANFNALENFNPRRGGDNYRWIPKGLPYDLWDSRNDNLPPLIDNVNGFTINQIFNALQSDVRSIPAFKDRFLLQNGNLQLLQINELFNGYNY
jgi:hypothetical protein